MEKSVFLLIGSTLWLSGLLFSQADFYSDINKYLTKNAQNCTKYIPKDLRKLLRNAEPPNDENLVLLESLLRCLHKSLRHMNESSPFALTQYPQILYNIALNEVVSLNFDGILAIKAHISRLLIDFLQRLQGGRKSYRTEFFYLKSAIILRFVSDPQFPFLN